jgi:hypothetical protein
MYPQCRCLRPGDQVSRAVALTGTPAHYHFLDARPRQPSRPHPAPADSRLAAAATPGAPRLNETWDNEALTLDYGTTPGAPRLNETWDREAVTLNYGTMPGAPRLNETWDNAADTCDYGTLPVGSEGPASNPPLALPITKDSAPLQLALTDILQALAANQLDPRRASVLLYRLQVASTHTKPAKAKHVSLRSDGTATPDHAIAASSPS